MAPKEHGARGGVGQERVLLEHPVRVVLQGLQEPPGPQVLPALRVLLEPMELQELRAVAELTEQAELRPRMEWQPREGRLTLLRQPEMQDQLQIQALRLTLPQQQ